MWFVFVCVCLLLLFVVCVCLVCVVFVGVVRWLLLLLSCWSMFIVGGLIVVYRCVFLLLFIVDCWSFVFVVVFCLLFVWSLFVVRCFFVVCP